MTTPDEIEDHDRGLSHDLPRILGRRGVLGIMGGVGAVALVGCAEDPTTTTSTSAGTTPSATQQGGPGTGGESSVEVVEGEIPEETAGPYPGDGSNGPNVLTESGVVRSDITTSFGSLSGTAEGIPVTVRLKVYDLNGAEATALPGAALYLWHCTREGGYSLYSEGVTDQNFLRGVQEADADGALSFTTIFPACYDGRWPHMHFEVYSSVGQAVANGPIVKTSQIALPQATCSKVYADSRYTGSAANLARTSLTSDMVFSDDQAIHQLATVTGNVRKGFVANLTIAV
jgi:protocatechuate 3,4-dioxygenase beta subunit